MNLRVFVVVRTSLKANIFKNKSQINSTITTTTWVLSAEGPERGQLEDCYLDEKIVVVPVCFNGRCCSAACMGIVSNLNGYAKTLNVSLLKNKAGVRCAKRNFDAAT